VRAQQLIWPLLADLWIFLLEKVVFKGVICPFALDPLRLAIVVTLVLGLLMPLKAALDQVGLWYWTQGRA